MRVLIDDLRSFDPVQESDITARDPYEAVEFLEVIGHIDELWLDHDMGIDTTTREELTIKPVWDYLLEMASNETPFPVDIIYVHTGNPYAGNMMVNTLAQAGYNVKREQDFPGKSGY